MGKKYFVWSFDDGVEQDKKITEILKQYNMGATFHLNSGLFGDKTYEGRIGNFGMKEVPADAFGKKRRILQYVPHFRIPEDEAAQVYEGFEVSSHTRTHANLTRCSAEQLRSEIDGDVSALSALFGTQIRGLAYPYGMSNKATYQAVKESGLAYARILKNDKSFRFPDDPLRLPMTCWHISKSAFKMIDDFTGAEADRDMFFLMFAHGYEFDFGTKESNWSKFEKICEKVSSYSNIVCCSIADALHAHNADGAQGVT